MKRFNFSLEKVLELRVFEQDQAQNELGKANAEVARIQRELDEIAVALVNLAKQYDSTDDFSFHVQSQNYKFFLEQKKEKLLEEIVQAQMIADEKREIVRDAMQKVKVLEKMKEKKVLQWKKENQKMEDNATDEAVTARFDAQ